MPKKKKPSPYKGVLQERFPPHKAPVGLLRLSDGLPEGMSEHDFRKAVIKRVAALLKHYGFPADIPTKSDWQKLAFRLAMDHIPGFQFSEQETRGRRQNEASDDEWLIEYIDNLREENGFRSDKRACEDFCAHPPSGRPPSLTIIEVGSLKNRLSKARKKQRKQQELAREWAALLAALSQQ
jgi:hypothetical protein